MNANVPPSPRSASTQNVLNSWKEIANYLDRGVRTVQRWEADLGLPVRRPRGKSRSAVIAMRSDLDAWLKACPLSLRDRSQVDLSVPRKPQDLERPSQMSELILRSRGLRSEVEHSQVEFRHALNRLIERLEHMGPQFPGKNRPRAA